MEPRKLTTPTLIRDSAVIVTFGRHQGKHIKDIPTSYLDWMLSKVDNLSTTQMELILDEIEYRESLIAKPIASHVPDRLQEVYRALSKKYHPDVGGSKEAMQAINEFYSALKKVNK